MDTSNFDQVSVVVSSRASDKEQLHGLIVVPMALEKGTLLPPHPRRPLSCHPEREWLSAIQSALGESAVVR